MSKIRRSNRRRDRLMPWRERFAAWLRKKADAVEANGNPNKAAALRRDADFWERRPQELCP